MSNSELIQDSDESALAMPPSQPGSRSRPQASSPESIEPVTPLTDCDKTVPVAPAVSLLSAPASSNSSGASSATSTSSNSFSTMVYKVRILSLAFLLTLNLLKTTLTESQRGADVYHQFFWLRQVRTDFASGPAEPSFCFFLLPSPLLHHSPLAYNNYL